MAVTGTALCPRLRRQDNIEELASIMTLLFASNRTKSVSA
jgi:hypothetical protein